MNNFFFARQHKQFLTFSSLSNSQDIVESVPILGSLLSAEFGNETLWVTHLSLIWLLFSICYWGWTVSAVWRESLKKNAIIRTCLAIIYYCYFQCKRVFCFPSYLEFISHFFEWSFGVDLIGVMAEFTTDVAFCIQLSHWLPSWLPIPSWRSSFKTSLPLECNWCLRCQGLIVIHRWNYTNLKLHSIHQRLSGLYLRDYNQISANCHLWSQGPCSYFFWQNIFKEIVDFMTIIW